MRDISLAGSRDDAAAAALLRVGADDHPLVAQAGSSRASTDAYKASMEAWARRRLGVSGSGNRTW